MVNAEPVFTCNLFNEGFDDLYSIEKHIEYEHGKIVEWTSCGDGDCGIGSECTIMKKYEDGP